MKKILTNIWYTPLICISYVIGFFMVPFMIGNIIAKKFMHDVLSDDDGKDQYALMKAKNVLVSRQKYDWAATIRKWEEELFKK